MSHFILHKSDLNNLNFCGFFLIIKFKLHYHISNFKFSNLKSVNFIKFLIFKKMPKRKKTLRSSKYKPKKKLKSNKNISMDDENNFYHDSFESSDPETEWFPEEELGKEEKKRFRTTKSKKKYR